MSRKIIEVVYISIYNEDRLETIAFSLFNSVTLNKFNLYKYEGSAYIPTQQLESLARSVRLREVYMLIVRQTDAGYL